MPDELIDPARFPSLEAIRNTVALEDDAILRNLKITQGYQELSRAMTAMVRGGNVSWCGFAAWSSKTIGVFLRDASTRERGLHAITQSGLYQFAIRGILGELAKAGLPIGEPPEEVLEKALDKAIESLKLGNVEVYQEIATLYSTLISALGNDANLDLARLAPVTAYLDMRAPEDGGQRLLGQAAENYYRARFEPDGQLKAQLVLLGNAQIGKHEQIRLQPRIEVFLGSSLEQKIVEYWQRVCAGRPAIGRLVTPIARDAGKLAKDEWTRFLTGLVLHLDLPGNERLHLGADVPPPLGKALYPQELQNLNNAEALAILREFGADRSTAAGTGANNWSDLTQRMLYILVLFRSRQLEAILLSDTFSPPQVADLAQGRMPTEPPPL
jgi:hypothetical protein